MAVIAGNKGEKPTATTPPPVPVPPQKTAPTHDDHRLRRGSVGNAPPSSLVSPLKAPTEPPQPALTNIGFPGGINEFNQRVQQTHDSFVRVHGYEPSPGLVLDVARSGAPLTDLDRMLAPTSATRALNAAAAANIHPDNALVVRHDGYVEHQPVAAQQVIAPHIDTFQSLQKQHPWVAMGMLPISPDLLNGFWSAVSFAQKNPSAIAPLTVGGQTIDQYQKQVEIGQGLTGTRAGETPGLYSSSLAPGNQSIVKPGSIKAVEQAGTAVKGAQNVQQAQDALKKVAPDFFANLPSTGYINSDWAKAIGKYQSSETYFRQQTLQLAHDNHFGDNTAAFIDAWKTKQSVIKANPFLRVFLEHQPLAVFDTKTHGAALAHLLTGDTKGWGWANIPTVALGSLVHTAGLALGGISGTIDQAKVDGAFVAAYMQSISPKWVMFPTGAKGLGETESQARANAVAQLKKHPTWARVLDPNYETDWRAGKTVGQIANIGIDLWLGAPKFTGEKILAGDLAAVKGSRYFAAKTSYAYNALAQGKLGEAVASLEGGVGAEKLNAALELQVQDGEMTLAQYRHHVAELYANGATRVGETDVNGAVFRSLRTKNLPTPGRVGSAASGLRKSLSDLTDQFENSLRSRTQVGETSNAANFIAHVRQLTARVSPAGERRSIFQDVRLPQDVYNYARTELGAGPARASELRDQIIRIRASGDVQAADDFAAHLRELFAAVHPKVPITFNPVESAGPELESESRSYLTFPKAIETRGQKITQALNKIGRVHRNVIVSGDPNPAVVPFVPGFGESLAFKHVFADTTRRVVGGASLFPVDGAGKALVDSFLRDNPTAIRDIGTARASAEMGETRYITGQKPTDALTFRTGDMGDLVIKGSKVGRNAALKAAGGYLRHTLTSDALKAFQASTKDDLQPLVNAIMRSRDLRGVLKVATGDQAEVAAEALFNRYKEIEEAGQKAGIADPLNEALGVLIANKGAHADSALGKWIGDNKIDMPVRDGLVEQKQWDDTMQWWIGKLMTANKWNRRQLFDHVFYGTTKDLVNSGWKTEDAIVVAADLAKAQTIYHMLDFSNMLQVEQNMRWLSYFATKHRLYWSWILKQAVQRPGLAAGVSDVKDHLDSKGNLDFTIAGHQFYVPAARLFWVNNREYPQTSPLVQFGAEFGKGVAEGHGAGPSVSDAFSSLTSTSGNLITRDDQAEMMGVKLALVATGHMPATSDAVTMGMSPTNKRIFQEQVNQYSAFYRQEHGVYPSEADAVKHTLLGTTAQEFWRTNLPLPVLWDGQGAPSPAVKKLHDQYNKIISPAQKRAFLDDHPALALQFGVSQDPAVYLHVGPLWDKFNAAQKQVQQQRDAIWQDMVLHGYSAKTKQEMKALSAWWSAQIDKLKLEDAGTWQGNLDFKPGKISDGKVVTPGPWTTQLEGDPFAARAFIHQSFPGIKEPTLDAHTVGQNIINLQNEAAILRAATTPAAIAKIGYPDAQHVRERLAEINTILAPFFGYPKDAASKAQSLYYQKYVGPYIKQRDAQSNALKLAPQDQQDALRSEFRAWKDQHDHPVVVTVNGKNIKFPSVVQIGWSTLPQSQRRLGLAQAVSGDWSHVASYEKTMLGVNTSPAVSQGWAAYYDAVRAYSKNPSNPGLVSSQKIAVAKQIDKVYPGFYKDYLFSQRPKIERFQATNLYQSMPDRKLFDQYVVGPAKQVIQAIKTNGNRRYYEKAWRNYVEQELTPWLNGQPALKNEITQYGPDFLNTLVSN